MDNMQVIIDGKTYRKGYTTGTTAAAAAKAAAMYWKSGKAPVSVEVTLPNMEIVTLKVEEAWTMGQAYWASVVKDGGDDIDVTNGLILSAEVVVLGHSNSLDIQVLGGVGVGIITKNGLQRNIGEPAINPVPLTMIENGIKEIMGSGYQVQVTIHVPKGEEAAKRTFNPRLGVVGGISIIGSTGIVEPMSEEAWKKSLEIELSQKVRQGQKKIVLVPGNHGEKFAIASLKYREDQIVMMSNFVGYMLMEACRLGVKEVILVGHIGKLIKVAGGNFHTHNRVSDGRMDVLCNHLAKVRAAYDLMDRVRESNTTDEAVALIDEAGLEVVYESIAKVIKDKAESYTYDQLKVEVALYNMKGRLLAKTMDDD
jgi:cobalt-precorrin-5B (C1)-methyltransferase